MRNATIAAAATAILAAASAYAQTTDFFELVKSGTPQDVQSAISKGAAVDAMDSISWTPLMHAAQNNQNPEVVTVLLKAGANIKAKGKGGVTPLMLAAGRNKNPLVITTLLKAGANRKIKDKMEKTAFDYAQMNRALKDTEALNKLK